MKEIQGQAKTIREILKDQRYSIDYFQRGYRWQKKQVQELMDDLTEEFLKNYSPTDAREDVQSYGHYFLGPIILSRRGNEVYIVDGQQRLTTLGLLLILLHRRQGKRADRVKLEDLIYSERFGRRTFNIEVRERAAIMEALFKAEVPNVSDSDETEQNIAYRYQDLDELFSDEIDDHALPYFCDWLIENVHFVEITATTDEDAYTIFETMNDRGLSLAPLDMLKGFLLANITDVEKRNEAARIWGERIESLRRLGKDDASDAVKAWLRARHAQSVRDRHRGAENRDFELIAKEFHRWVGKHEEQLGLARSDDFFHFVHREFAFYTRQYERLRQASDREIPGLEPVYHVACFNFTLQYPLLLAPLRMSDDETTLQLKIRAVATFLDILLARRAVNYLSLTFSAMTYAMFLIVRDIRDKSLPELIEILRRKLDEQGCSFDGSSTDETRGGLKAFGLNQWSKRYIKVLLARMTVYVERESGKQSLLATYLAEGKGRYEIEHIWANHAERHPEFASPYEFADYRNRFGGLLLLPKDLNASLGDMPYSDGKDADADERENVDQIGEARGGSETKLRYYYKENLLASSLHRTCYERNPGFIRFVESSGLLFRSHPHFKKVDLDERGRLYRQIAERIWNPDNLRCDS